MTTSRHALALLAGLALAAPALAATYPVSGKWGQTASTEKAPIDCSKLRVIAFNGNRRTDSKGGAPAYRNRSVQASGAGQFSVVDVFTTGQISNAHVSYTLRVVDGDTLEMKLEKGGTVRLRKCT